MRQGEGKAKTGLGHRSPGCKKWGLDATGGAEKQTEWLLEFLVSGKGGESVYPLAPTPPPHGYFSASHFWSVLAAGGQVGASGFEKAFGQKGRACSVYTSHSQAAASSRGWNSHGAVPSQLRLKPEASQGR